MELMKKSRVESKMVPDALVKLGAFVFKDPIEALIDGEGNILVEGVIMVSETLVEGEDTALVGVQQLKVEAGWEVSVIVGDYEEDENMLKAEIIGSTDEFEVMSGMVLGLILARRASELQKDLGQKISLAMDAEVQKLEGKSQ